MRLTIIDRPSPSHGLRRKRAVIDMLVLHYTGMKTLEGALKRLCDAKAAVSAHYLVARDGRVLRLVDERRRAWHAGVSRWQGERDVNSRSIGIELENPGDLAYPKKQMQALTALARYILKRHKIPKHRVLGHSDVAPRRKIDPGGKFPWRALAKAGVGYWPKPGRAKAVPGTAAVQRALADFGYEIEATGRMDAQTKAVIAAFQRHFRPKRVNGKIDRETAALAAALTLAPRRPT